MGAKRTITEEVDDVYGDQDRFGGGGGRSEVAESSTQAAQRNGAGPDGSTSQRARTRTTTDLEWILEFVARKVQNCILSNLKTARVHLLLFGSNETNAGMLEEGEVKRGYEGVNEIKNPSQADLETLDTIRNMRAMSADDGAHPADPLDAIVCALATLNAKKRGGCDRTSKQWRRVIYVITAGETEINEHNIERIKQEVIDSNVAIKVVGIDFDDAAAGIKEEGKSPVKARAEAFWKQFLAGIPGSAVASAASVIAQNSLPSIHMQGSAPYNTVLSFGDFRDAEDQSQTLRIPVKMYKATAVVRPIGATQISRISQKNVEVARQRSGNSSSPARTMVTPTKPIHVYNEGNGSLDSPSKVPHYKVERHRRYYVREDLERLEGGINSANPLPEGSEASFGRAYKLGATLVTITDEIDTKMDTLDGIEIIQYTNEHSFRRYFNMGETSYVFASDDNVRAQSQFSSLVKALVEQGKYATVRLVRRNGADPKLGILAPQPYDEENGYDYEGLYYCEMPFRQDYIRHRLEPLNRAITISNEETTEHAKLPTKEMLATVDQLLDDGDLCDAEEDEDGETIPWFRTEESYNPAIHNTRDALARRVFKPQDRILPKPHPDVMRFLEAPDKIVKRSEVTIKRCQDLFDLTYGATSLQRRNRARKENEAAKDIAAAEPKEIDLGGAMDEELAAERGASGQPASAVSDPPRTPEPQPRTPQRHTSALADSVTRERATSEQVENATAIAAQASGSETEDDDEGASTSRSGRNEAALQSKEQRVSTVAQSISFAADDPVADFEKKLSTPSLDLGDVIDAMGTAITTIIASSFGSNEYGRARDMMSAMRKGAIEYEEANRYNTFVRKLKTRVLEGTGSGQKERARPEFWDEYVRGRDDLGLVTDREAIGEETRVDVRVAGEFINL